MDKKVYEFISEKSGEKIVEWKKCICGEEFPITDKDMGFYDKISPIFNGVKYHIPAPTLCPDCRQKRRMVWRNERSLYKRKCDFTEKTIISMFSPEKKYKVYDQKVWWSDKWNSMDYGREFDFSRKFSEQFNELMLDIPHPSLSSDYANSVNSDYVNCSGAAKNCYLLFENGSNEDCLYGYNVYYVKDSLELAFVYESENCYECVDVHKGYNLLFATNCNDCRDSYFIENCNNCSNCFMCFGLRNKSYYILNKQYDKTTYEKMLAQVKYSYPALQKIHKDFLNMKKGNIQKNLQGINNENVYGNNVSNSKNIKISYDVSGCNDSAYITQFTDSNDCYDCHSWGSSDKTLSGASLCYDSCAIGNVVSNIYHSYVCWGGINNAYYIYRCVGGNNLFGCAALVGKEYCILNKQYTKEEYNILIPKIIEHMKKTGEWGEFFPTSISTFGYNESPANDHFKLTREEAITAGYNWQEKEYPINIPENIELVKSQDLPENIGDVGDDILQKAIVCEISGKPFRIVNPELEFYRKHGLPLPRKHPDVRHAERFSRRAPRKLFLRNCDKCGIEMISVYDKDSEYKVYCEECYSKEVV